MSSPATNLSLYIYCANFIYLNLETKIFHILAPDFYHLHLPPLPMQTHYATNRPTEFQGVGLLSTSGLCSHHPFSCEMFPSGPSLSVN